MGLKWTKMSVKETTKKLIVVDFKKQFLSEHPEMIGMKLTEDFLLHQIVNEALKVQYEHY